MSILNTVLTEKVRLLNKKLKSNASKYEKKNFEEKKTCLSRIVTEFNNLLKLNKYLSTNDNPGKNKPVLK